MEKWSKKKNSKKKKINKKYIINILRIKMISTELKKGKQ